MTSTPCPWAITASNVRRAATTTIERSRRGTARTGEGDGQPAVTWSWTPGGGKWCPWCGTYGRTFQLALLVASGPPLRPGPKGMHGKYGTSGNGGSLRERMAPRTKQHPVIIPAIDLL